MRWLLLLLISFGFVTLGSPAQAACETTGDLIQVASECDRTADEIRDLYATAADDGYTYSLETRCKPGDNLRACQVYASCRTAGGETGTIYLLFRTDDATGARERYGEACLLPSDVTGLATITPAMVRREFERLSWPTADLEVQPPDGQTLINFDTNFFTDNTEPTARTVTLLGQRVEIEARPVEYTWEFGDGATRTTTSPGAAYPELDVTHEYAEPGRVGPSVATTYAGRYRVNGDAWQTIPGTLSVQGEAVALRVRSASPHLVGTTSN